jgi:hypothetical protein
MAPAHVRNEKVKVHARTCTFWIAGFPTHLGPTSSTKLPLNHTMTKYLQTKINFSSDIQSRFQDQTMPSPRIASKPEGKGKSASTPNQVLPTVISVSSASNELPAQKRPAIPAPHDDITTMMRTWTPGQGGILNDAILANRALHLFQFVYGSLDNVC